MVFMYSHISLIFRKLGKTIKDDSYIESAGFVKYDLGVLIQRANDSRFLAVRRISDVRSRKKRA